MGITAGNLFAISTAASVSHNNLFVSNQSVFFEILPLLAIGLSILCIGSFIITRLIKLYI